MSSIEEWVQWCCNELGYCASTGPWPKSAVTERIRALLEEKMTPRDVVDHMREYLQCDGTTKEQADGPQ